jgi:hypothetical protein
MAFPIVQGLFLVVQGLSCRSQFHRTATYSSVAAVPTARPLTARHASSPPHLLFIACGATGRGVVFLVAISVILEKLTTEMWERPRFLGCRTWI